MQQEGGGGKDMFFGFSVTGVFLRPFMQLLQTASKQGDGLFFEPCDDVLKLRAVNNARSTHFLITIAAEHLDDYRCTNREKKVASTGPRCVEQPSQANSSCGEKEDPGFYLMLPSKALAATVLRQAQGLFSIHVCYNGAETSADMVLSCDTFKWECVMASGIVKKFSLLLAEGRPERSYVAPEVFSFDACAAAKVWGALLGWFPALTPRVVVQPLESSLEVWVVDHTKRVENVDGISREAGVGGGADTRVVASWEHFLFLQQRPQDEDATPTPITTISEGGKARAMGRRSRIAPLPGKVIEVKPLKQVCMLADQLGMMIRLRSGVEGLPVFVEAITAEAAQQAAFAASSAADGFPPVTIQNLLNKHFSPADNQFRVTFSMYIAAFDVPQHSLDVTETATVSARRSTNSVISALGDEHRIPQASAVTSIPFPLQDDVSSAAKGNALAATTHDMLTGLTMPLTNTTGVENPALESACSPARVLVAPSFTQGVHRGSGELSMVDASTATPFHSDGMDCNQYYPPPSPTDTMMVVKATPDAGGGSSSSAVQKQQEYQWRGTGNCNKRRRERCETDVESPHHSVSSSSSNNTNNNNNVIAADLSFVAPTNVSSDGCFRQPNQTTSGCEQTPLTAHNPLDFNAFMREIADETMEEDFDEDDAELQRFLVSCTSLLVVPATPSAPPK